jgi:hypothetical protein
MTSLEELKFALQETELTQYHEAGHAVASYIYGFRPKLISGPLYKDDRRSTSSLKKRSGLLATPSAREKAQRFAVSNIAGIAAESRVSGVPLAELRQTSGLGDYVLVRAIADRIMLHTPFEYCSEVSASYIQLWETRAVALMNQPTVWGAVEALTDDLQMCEGEMNGTEIVEAIKRGMRP